MCPPRPAARGRDDESRGGHSDLSYSLPWFTSGSTDYAHPRTLAHAARANRLCSETVPAGGHPTASAAHSLRELGRHSVYALAGAQSEVLVRLLVARLDARSTSINQSEASCQKQREFNDLTFVFGHYSTDCKPQILRRQPASDGLINRSDQTTSTPSTTLGRTRLRTES